MENSKNYFHKCELGDRGKINSSDVSKVIHILGWCGRVWDKTTLEWESKTGVDNAMVDSPRTKRDWDDSKGIVCFSKENAPPRSYPIYEKILTLPNKSA